MWSSLPPVAREMGGRILVRSTHPHFFEDDSERLGKIRRDWERRRGLAHAEREASENPGLDQYVLSM